MTDEEELRAADGVGTYDGAGSCPHEIGDKVRFRPAGFINSRDAFGPDFPVEVTGTVIQIHEEHRWYRVQYTMPGCIGHECFKF